MTTLAMARMLEVATNCSYRIAGKEINSSDEFSKGMVYHKLKSIEIDEKYEDNKEMLIDLIDDTIE